MLIALLAVLGVDLIVIVIVVAVLLARRAWESHQPGAFKGAIELVAVDGMTGQVQAAGPDDKVKRLRHGLVIVPLTGQQGARRGPGRAQERQGDRTGHGETIGHAAGTASPERFVRTAFCLVGVELRGLEPLTPCLQSRCSSN